MTPDAIAVLLQPYLRDAPEPTSGWAQLYEKLGLYLDLILKWNDRTNLTAIRQPTEIVRRHFGQSLFAGLHLSYPAQPALAVNLDSAAQPGFDEIPYFDAQVSPPFTLLDYGSGAGFPGLPIQLLRPDVRVTLAESQSKKAAFLREAVRTLGLPTEVLSGRVESLPDSTRFDTVTLRAVDKMKAALREARKRASLDILILTTEAADLASRSESEFEVNQRLALPESSEGILLILRRC